MSAPRQGNGGELGAGRGPDPERGDPSDRGHGPDPARPPGPTDDVAGLRREIEALDRTLLEIVADRVQLARRIGQSKRGRDAATLDPGREAAVIRRAVETGRQLDLPEEPVRQLFWTLVGLCRAAQLEER